LLWHELRELLQLLLLGILNVQQLLECVQELRRLYPDGTTAEPLISKQTCRRGVVRRRPES
jgi:hypothetical protein